MSTTSNSVNLADYYYGFLSKLSKESKIDLIEKLAKSLKEEEEIVEDQVITVEEFFEAFKTDLTAREILAEIKALKEARTVKRSAGDAGLF